MVENGTRALVEPVDDRFREEHDDNAQERFESDKDKTENKCNVVSRI